MATHGEPFADVDTAQESKYRLTFTVMCVCFGLNHAAVTTPVGYATSLLGTDVGNASNMILYGVCMVSSLLLGPMFTGILGPKKALLLGMICYVVYVILFALATLFTHKETVDGKDVTEADSAAWILAVIGSLVGGIGAGSLWTAQGAFFSAICEKISDATGTQLQALTAQLSSSFAVWYLGQECLWKVLFTLLTKYAKIPFGYAFIIYGALALVATVVLGFTPDARPKNLPARAPFFARAAAALGLWADPKIWLLMGSNVTFGFAAAYLNGYVNSNWQREALGSDDFIGFLGAIICLIATISSKVYGWAAEKMGTKMPIVVLGSLCFLAQGLLSLIKAPHGRGPGGWGAGIVVFYILQGMGRGVYESTNKGIFGDFFPGEKGVGAFANCMMQNTLSSTIGFGMGLAGVDKYEVIPLMIFSVFTVPALAIASRMRAAAPVAVEDAK